MMINGETTVTYTPINGENIYGISTYNDTRMIGSSHGSNTEGAAFQAVNVLWQLPGGITNKDGNWGYLLWKKTQDPNTANNEDVVSFIQQQYPAALFNESNELQNSEYEASIKLLLNNKMYEYVLRLLKLEDKSNYTEFVSFFGVGTCVIIG